MSQQNENIADSVGRQLSGDIAESYLAEVGCRLGRTMAVIACVELANLYFARLLIEIHKENQNDWNNCFTDVA